MALGIQLKVGVYYLPRMDEIIFIKSYGSAMRIHKGGLQFVHVHEAEIKGKEYDNFVVGNKRHAVYLGEL